MRVAIERLLRSVIDFAGTSPPTANALEKFFSGIEGSEKWILNRFICSTADLAELAIQLEKQPGRPHLPVAAIGRQSRDRRGWEDALTADAEAMNVFQRRMGDRAEIEAYEIQIPGEGNSEFYVNDLVGFRDADLFVEIPLADGFEDVLGCLAETEWVGAKVRCGGDGAAPDSNGLAGLVRSCLDLELPFKLTAGLHQPMSQIEPLSYGFLSVAGAVALGLAEDLSRREIEQILRDPDEASWRFDDRGLAWRDRIADLEAIDESRNLFTCFDSYSGDDPIESLQAFL